MMKKSKLELTLLLNSKHLLLTLQMVILRWLLNRKRIFCVVSNWCILQPMTQVKLYLDHLECVAMFQWIFQFSAVFFWLLQLWNGQHSSNGLTSHIMLVWIMEIKIAPANILQVILCKDMLPLLLHQLLLVWHSEKWLKELPTQQPVKSFLY